MSHQNGAKYVVKSTAKDSQEADNLRRLLACPDLNNHTIPAEVIECEDSYVIIMPYVMTSEDIPWHLLGRPITVLLDLFAQMAEVH